MSEISYVNFDLYIKTMSARDYRVEVTSPAGSTTNIMSLPIPPEQLAEIIRLLDSIKDASTRMSSPDADKIKNFGWNFFNKVFTGDVYNYMLSSIATATDAGAVLRVRLRLSGLSELANLPWEFLYMPRSGDFIQLLPGISLVRYLELSDQPLYDIKLPLRILLVCPNPSDRPVAPGWNRILSSLADLEQEGMLALDYLEHPTFFNLQRRLEEKEYHVIHYTGYGEAEAQVRDGVLLLENELGHAELVSGLKFGEQLANFKSIGLVVLSAAEPIRTGIRDPFAVTAQSLVQLGLPAVIATQLQMSEQSAMLLAQNLYRSLVVGLPVEAALDEARRAIAAAGSDIEWGLPALYTRSKSGALFSFDATSKSRQSQLRAGPVFVEAQQALALKQWDVAIEKLEKVLEVTPGNTEAALKLKQARQQKLQSLYDKGMIQRAERQWRNALGTFQQVKTENEEYEAANPVVVEVSGGSSPGSMFAQMQGAQSDPAEQAWREKMSQVDGLIIELQSVIANINQASNFYTEAIKDYEAKRWPVAIEKLQKVLQLNPWHPEAESKLSEARQQLEWSAMYGRALKFFNASKFDEAQVELQELQKQAGPYKDVDRLINEILAKQGKDKQIADWYGEVEKAFSRKEWTPAIVRLDDILNLDKYQSEAQDKRAYAVQQLLIVLYSNALNNYHNKRWKEAIEGFRQVKLQDSEGKYKNVEELLAECDRNLKEEQSGAARPAAPGGWMPPGIQPRSNQVVQPTAVAQPPAAVANRSQPAPRPGTATPAPAAPRPAANPNGGASPAPAPAAQARPVQVKPAQAPAPAPTPKIIEQPTEERDLAPVGAAILLGMLVICLIIFLIIIFLVRK